MSFRFRNTFKRICPAWLWGGAKPETGEGERVLWTLGLLEDAVAEAWRQSLLASMPSFAPSDALTLLGRDRGIVRGINEPDEAYAARMLTFLEDNKQRGMPHALGRQLQAYCQAPVAVRIVDNNGNWFTLDRDGSTSYRLRNGDWNWDGQPWNWARFWVLIYMTPDGRPWSHTWDPTLGASDGTTTATADQIASVLSIVRAWSPAATQCQFVMIVDGEPSDTLGPDLPGNPDGTWGEWAFGNLLRPSRSTKARYWRGLR